MQELESHKGTLDALAKLRSAADAAAGHVAAALQALVSGPYAGDKQTVQKPKAPELQALQRFVCAVSADRSSAGRKLPGLIEQAAKRLQVDVLSVAKPAATFTEQQVQERVNTAVRAAGAGAAGAGAAGVACRTLFAVLVATQVVLALSAAPLAAAAPHSSSDGHA